MRARLFSFLLVAIYAIAQTTTEQATGSISGVVTDVATGTPLADVEIYANRGSRDSSQVVTDKQGRYTLRNVKPGRHRIAAATQVGRGSSVTRFITAIAGQEVASIDFQLQLPGALSGKITDENKEPLSGIAVFLIAREYSLGALRYVYAGMTTTDDRGEYSLNRVVPGRAFLLMAQKRPGKLDAISESPLDPKARKTVPAPTFYPGGASIEGAQPIVLRAGERRENVDLRMVRMPSRCIEGTGQATGGSEPLYFQIAGHQPTSGAWGDGAMYVSLPGGVTGTDGKMRLCGWPPGEYQLNVFTDPRSGPPGFYGTAIIVVGDRDVDKILVNTRPAIAMEGEVVWAGEPQEAPITSQLAVVLRPLTRPGWRGEDTYAQASIPGRFSFKHLLVDEYSLQLLHVPESLYVKDITYRGHSVMGEPLRIGSATGDVGLKILLARDGATINTTVADREGKPVADAHVLVLPLTVTSEAALAASITSGQTDQSGAWSSPRLSPGKYHVLASPRAIDKSPESLSKLWRARLRAQELELTPNGSTQVKLTPESIE